MPVSVSAILRIKPDMLHAFEQAFTDYQQKVREREPGNLFFQLNRSRDESGTYLVMEKYTDDAALDTHRNTAHYKEIPAIFGGFMAGPPEILVFDCIG